MSITASYVIVFVIVIRLLLRKFPKIFSYILWFTVLFRLMFPFSFESIFSLIPENVYIPQDIAYSPKQEINSEMISNSVNNVLQPHVNQGATVNQTASINPMQVWIVIGEAIWIIGIAALLIYSVFTTAKLYHNLRKAKHVEDNIYNLDGLKTPFVFGIINPKIYLPVHLSESEKSYVLLHEQTHIKRLDHIVKPVFFLITCIHWFNPLIWIAFYLMGEDMELSCDEKVLRQMGSNIKKEYSTSLLSMSTGRKIIGGSPLTFGENNTRGRIKNVLNYKKPRFWVIAVAIVIIIILAVGLLTNPPDNGDKYKVDETKVVRITRQSFLDETRDSEVDQNIWADLIDEINNGKWSDLSEENFPDVDDIFSTITITLARDESVNNKEYVLCIYRNKHTKFLGGNEYEFSLALAYDDLTDNIKMWNLHEDSYYKIRDILNSSNPKLNGEESNEIWDLIPMIMVNGELYLDTGKQILEEIDKSAIIGEISSSVDGSEKPTKEGQTNFGLIGTKYAHFEDNIVVLINDEWFLFAKENIGYIKNIDNKRFYIMTADDGAPHGCEYGTTRETGQIDILEMLSMLEKLKGFKFDEDYVSHQYIEFQFLNEKPKDIYLRYIAKDEWQTEYPIDSETYKIKVPTKVGAYSFFAEITWENLEKETVFFDITIKSPSYDKISAYLKEKYINVFSPYYELLDFIIYDYQEEIIDGKVEAVFHYKVIEKNYDKDPDTVEYIKEAKERGDKNYQIYYDEYLQPREMNFYFKAVIDENDEIILYTRNTAIESEKWHQVEISDYIIK